MKNLNKIYNIIKINYLKGIIYEKKYKRKKK